MGGYGCLLAPGTAYVHAIYDKDRIVPRYRIKYTSKGRPGNSYPDYWGKVKESSPNLVLVTSAKEESALKKCLIPEGEVGKGRDVRQHGEYSRFRLACAWRLEHPGLWAKYAAEVLNLKTIEFPALKNRFPKMKLRNAFYEAYKSLPPELDGEINEVMLLHGTKPDTVLKILSGGMNERYSGGIFGNGIYFAEDVAKNDQYVTEDTTYSKTSELHKKLFEKTKHPGKIFYVFLCRVVLGVPQKTKTGCSDVRECEAISGTNYLHHSLLAETGGIIARFREFIQFHGSRVYPEYLLAYQRV